MPCCGGGRVLVEEEVIEEAGGEQIVFSSVTRKHARVTVTARAPVSQHAAFQST